MCVEKHVFFRPSKESKQPNVNYHGYRVSIYNLLAHTSSSHYTYGDSIEMTVSTSEIDIGVKHVRLHIASR